jgi:hypothetical protein
MDHRGQYQYGGKLNLKSYTCGRILGRKEKWAWEFVKQLFKLKIK